MLENTILWQRLVRYSKLREDYAWLFTFLTDRNLKHDIIKLVQDNQLQDKGIDGDGNVIGYYSYLTEIISKGKKQHGDHYTLNDTGDFFRSFYITVLRDAFEINADGNKGDENLFDKYGENVVNLTQESLEVVRERIKNGFINYILQLD